MPFLGHLSLKTDIFSVFFKEFYHRMAKHAYFPLEIYHNIFLNTYTHYSSLQNCG